MDTKSEVVTISINIESRPVRMSDVNVVVAALTKSYKALDHELISMTTPRDEDGMRRIVCSIKMNNIQRRLSSESPEEDAERALRAAIMNACSDGSKAANTVCRVLNGAVICGTELILGPDTETGTKGASESTEPAPEGGKVSSYDIVTGVVTYSNQEKNKEFPACNCIAGSEYETHAVYVAKKGKSLHSLTIAGKKN